LSEINAGMIPSARMRGRKKSETFVMPTETIVVLAVVIAAFAAFMAVVAYGDQQTRHLSKR
jgi:hypothetical protein